LLSFSKGSILVIRAVISVSRYSLS